MRPICQAPAAHESAQTWQQHLHAEHCSRRSGRRRGNSSESAQAVSYRGIFSAEFKCDDRDGFFKILEVNARPWWYVEAAACAGMDVCSMAYHDALGPTVEPWLATKLGSILGYCRLIFGLGTNSESRVVRVSCIGCAPGGV